jgi:hypothetical protein
MVSPRNRRLTPINADNEKPRREGATTRRKNSNATMKDSFEPGFSAIDQICVHLRSSAVSIRF